MNCRHVRRHLNAYDLGALDEATRRKVAAHVEGCAACRAEWGRVRAVGRALGALSEADSPAHLWPGISRRLRPRRRLSAWVWEVWEPVAAVATGVLLVFAIMYGAVAPRLGPPDVSFEAVQTRIADDAQEVAAGWQHPLADEAVLGLQLALWEGEGDET